MAQLSQKDISVLLDRQLPKHDTYWKLQTYTDRKLATHTELTAKEMRDILESRKYFPSKNATKAHLTACLERSNRGLLIYTKYPNKELRRLLKQRRPSKEHMLLGSRERLLAELERLDKTPAFTRFASLPAELRNRIYELYFSQFEGPLYAPSQPPLTLINSAIRQECLPLFYGNCAFEVICTTRAGAANRAEAKFIMTDRSMLWLHSIDPHLPQMKQIRLRVARTDGSSYGQFETAWVELAIEKIGLLSFAWCGWKGYGVSPSTLESRICLLAGKLLRDARAAEGTAAHAKFSKDFVFQLRREMELVYRGQ